jgi:hypothetical protein
VGRKEVWLTWIIRKHWIIFGLICGITSRDTYALLLIHWITNGLDYWITQSQITNGLINFCSDGEERERTRERPPVVLIITVAAAAYLLRSHLKSLCHPFFCGFRGPCKSNA